MIIQSSNKPILIKFSDSITKDTILRITLWSKIGTKLKEWTKEDIVIEDDVVSCSLSQEETAKFPVGDATLEIKWLNDDGITEFANKIKIDIVSRFDTISMEVETND